MSILAMTCSVLHGNRFPWVLVDEFVFGCHGMWARMSVANPNPAGTALEWCVVDDDGTPPADLAAWSLLRAASCVRLRAGKVHYELFNVNWGRASFPKYSTTSLPSWAPTAPLKCGSAIAGDSRTTSWSAHAPMAMSLPWSKWNAVVLKALAVAKQLRLRLGAVRCLCLKQCSLTLRGVPGSCRKPASLETGAWQILSALLGNYAANCAAPSCKALCFS